jgi:hypothetical protein
MHLFQGCSCGFVLARHYPNGGAADYKARRSERLIIVHTYIQWCKTVLGNAPHISGRHMARLHGTPWSTTVPPCHCHRHRNRQPAVVSSHCMHACVHPEGHCLNVSGPSTGRRLICSRANGNRCTHFCPVCSDVMRWLAPSQGPNAWYVA